jgi:hypothetical protein
VKDAANYRETSGLNNKQQTKTNIQEIIMAPKALCGRLITSRRSFLALAWTLTTFLSLFSFIVAIFLATRITQQYTEYSAGYYNGGGRYLQEEGEDNNSRDGSHSNDEHLHIIQEVYYLLQYTPRYLV